MNNRFDDIDEFSTTTSSSYRRELNFKAAAYFNCSFDKLGRTLSSLSSSSCKQHEIDYLKSIRSRREAARLKFEEIRSNLLVVEPMPSTVSCSMEMDDDQYSHDLSVKSARNHEILSEGDSGISLSCSNRRGHGDNNNNESCFIKNTRGSTTKAIDCDESDEMEFHDVDL